MAAKIEEVILDADRWNAQQVCPHGRELLFEIGSRGAGRRPDRFAPAAGTDGFEDLRRLAQFARDAAEVHACRAGLGCAGWSGPLFGRNRRLVRSTVAELNELLRRKTV